jgi:hypothetical protein
MNPTLQRAVTSFYNLIYEAQTFATTMSRIDTAEQEHYAGRIEGLNWVLDRCHGCELDSLFPPASSYGSQIRSRSRIVSPTTGEGPSCRWPRGGSQFCRGLFIEPDHSYGH